MVLDDLKGQIEEIALPFLQNLQVEIVEFHLRPHKGKIFIDILADKPKGGITLYECSLINKHIIQRIEEGNLISEDYIVEVSSPGLDRPLKSPRDFSRVMGRRVRVILQEAILEKSEYAGVVKSVNEKEVLINFKNNIVNIPLEKIVKAVQIV